MCSIKYKQKGQSQEGGYVWYSWTEPNDGGMGSAEEELQV
jgi:hypothetical protein